jgi:hypothetical protein
MTIVQMFLVLVPLLIVYPSTTNGFQISHASSRIDFMTSVKASAPSKLPTTNAVFGASGHDCIRGCTSSTRNANVNSFTATKLSMANDNADSDQESVALSTPLDKPILAAIDFAALVLFAGVGKASHSADGSLDIQGVLTTAFPFLLSWFATSPFTGVYNDRNGNGVLDAGKLAAKGWIVAVPIGCALRGVIKGYIPPLPFVIVTLIVTLILLGGSRMLFSLVEDKVSNSEEI